MFEVTVMLNCSYQLWAIVFKRCPTGHVSMFPSWWNRWKKCIFCSSFFSPSLFLFISLRSMLFPRPTTDLTWFFTPTVTHQLCQSVGPGLNTEKNPVRGDEQKHCLTGWHSCCTSTRYYCDGLMMAWLCRSLCQAEICSARVDVYCHGCETRQLPKGHQSCCQVVGLELYLS